MKKSEDVNFEELMVRLEEITNKLELKKKKDLKKTIYL